MPELTVRVLDGDSDRILGKIGLTFSSPVREQLVIDRLARLCIMFGIGPVGGKLESHLNKESASENAKALRQLCNGYSTTINLPIVRLPTEDKKTSTSPQSSYLIYERIVRAVQTALKDALPGAPIDKGETDHEVYTSAIKSISNRAKTYEDILRDIKLALSEVESSVHDINAVPELVYKLAAKVRTLEVELEDCIDDREKYKTSLEEHEAKYTMLKRDFQRLTEETNQQHLAQQLADIDMFDDEPFPSSDQGAI